MQTPKTKTLTKPTEHLHITHPPLTNQITKLQQHLPLTLFIPSPTPLQLTSPPQILLQQAQSILSTLHPLQKKLLSTQEPSHLTIPTSQTIPP
ncbi:LysR family transcriptional regulator, partial [Priestia megaterium]|uniref:LysR family transcriptional regulator n=1 Tax=Priestia megaterium TaxID=1404 RepID=UPI00370989B4